jgi:N-acetylglucosaminyldiphosphoundecaprenol N-acetyl-beta-D-mannosaminyltransferase
MITKKVISLNISIIGFQNAIMQVIDLAKSKKPSYVCFANVHMIIEGHKNKDFAEKVNKADLVCADGMPVVKTIRSFYKINTERVAGMDIFPELLRAAELGSLKVYFFGTTNEILEKINTNARAQFPKLNVAGSFSPPFDKSIDDESYVEMIRSSGADLVFIALGCPKQETWMAKHYQKINAVLLGVGGAFPIYAGTAKRAPLVMRNMGLEWLYRLLQEPKRLFKRYFITNTLFMYLVAGRKLRSIFGKEERY